MADHRPILALIDRSPDRGDGWRSVSKVVWPALASLPEDLAERELLDDGTGRVRLTTMGIGVLRYG
jgi:hypothetical protein